MDVKWCHEERQHSCLVLHLCWMSLVSCCCYWLSHQCQSTCFQNLSFSHCINGISSLRMSNMDTHYEIHYSSGWRSTQGTQTENRQFSIPQIHSGMYAIVYIFYSMTHLCKHLSGSLKGYCVDFRWDMSFKKRFLKINTSF